MKLSLIILLAITVLLTACEKPISTSEHLQRIKQRGELLVISRYSPSSYYQIGDDWIGLEYDLARLFATMLGVRLKIIIPENFEHMVHLLERGHADLAAASITITQNKAKYLRFGPSYQEITQQLVYRRGNSRPKNLAMLTNTLFEVSAGSSHVDQLKQHQAKIPKLRWFENQQLDSSHLLELVQLEMIDYTIADSNEIALKRLYLPELRVAFDVSNPLPLAWALAKTTDDSLLDAVETFFNQITTSGELQDLLDHYYDHIQHFDYVDTRTFYRRILTRLPKYKTLFQHFGRKFNIDWRLLAAVSYQESHWNPKAISRTGVRGLMMITKATAKQMKIQDRQDPRQSIQAGAQYINFLRQRLPDRLKEPDKTWLTLAAYNIGLGHLEDARIITQKMGYNPDSWLHVRDKLPLLSDQKWYSTARYGYARGREPVNYIDNIRRYYDILVQIDRNETTQAKSHVTTRKLKPLPSIL